MSGPFPLMGYYYPLVEAISDEGVTPTPGNLVYSQPVHDVLSANLPVNFPQECMALAVKASQIYTRPGDFTDDTSVSTIILRDMVNRVKPGANLSYTGPTPQNLVWTFFADKQTAPFGVQCRVDFQTVSAMQNDTNAPRYAMSGAVEFGNNGLEGSCNLPMPYTDCLKPFAADPSDKPDMCVLMNAASTRASRECRDWYRNLEDAEKDVVVNNVCGDASPYKTMRACSCINSVSRTELEQDLFNVFNEQLFPITDKMCWWRTCKVGNDGVLLTETDKAVECTGDYCANAISIVDSTDVTVEEVNLFSSCTTNSAGPGDPGDPQPPVAGGGGGGGGGGDSLVVVVLALGGLGIIVAVLIYILRQR